MKLWRIVTGPGGKPAAQAVLQKSQTETEKLLEDALAASPELLLDGLRIVGRQCDTEVGPLDLLGLDEDGRLVVFELKRGTLRRDAVAQAVDYASFLGELTADQLSHFIEQNSSKLEGGRIEDFGAFYSSKFPKAVADMGKPRIILVGIGADSATKRMVGFLSQAGLDISILTFHAFADDGKIYLAKQVEAQSQLTEAQVSKNTKASNQAELSGLLNKLGIEKPFESVASAIANSFGPTCYRWPNPTSYVFSRIETVGDERGKRKNLITLYADSAHANEMRVYLQPRAVADAGLQTVKDLASALGSSIVETPTGYLYFWVNVTRQNLLQACTQLADAVAAGAARKADESASEAIDSDDV